MQRYLGGTIRRGTACIASSTPPPSRKVALNSLHRQLNDVVMIDQFYLDQKRLFHCMDRYCLFSFVNSVPDATVYSATVAFQTTWISQFWLPIAVKGDQAFAKREFRDYLETHVTKFRPVPSMKHHKNSLKPNHGVIRSIYIPLTYA